LQVENKNQSETKPRLSYNQNIYPTLENKNLNQFNSYNNRNEAYTNNIKYSNSNGVINYAKSEEGGNEHENVESFENNSEKLYKVTIANYNLNDLVKKRSNNTVDFVSSNKKNDMSQQTNRIFERNNNEIYFSKRK